MASSKRKSSPPPLHWFQRLKQRLTSRLAFFIWGALFGNAVLVQTISPWDLLTHSPESLLNQSWRSHLDGARQQLRSWGEGLAGDVGTLLKQRIGEALTPPTSAHAPATDSTQPASAAASSSSGKRSTTDSSNPFAACADQFPGSRPLLPSRIGSEWAPRALCSEGFAVLYSGRTKTPMVVVERLNRSRLQQAAGLERTDRFYADARVPSTQRADLADYQSSGYDRGHMAAAANQYSAIGMAQSFALTNMVPQDPTNNRKVWAKLEADVRKYVQRAAGDVFVFSGPLHQSIPHLVGPGQVWVPDHLFKLVYDASSQRAWAYVLPNTADAQISRPLDYADFVVQTQWHLLAGLPVTSRVH